MTRNHFSCSEYIFSRGSQVLTRREEKKGRKDPQEIPILPFINTIFLLMGLDGFVETEVLLTVCSCTLSSVVVLRQVRTKYKSKLKPEGLLLNLLT